MKRLSLVILVGCLLTVIGAGQSSVRAHCDTLDGPVVSAARSALEKGDVTVVLKWVRSEDEKEIGEVFQKVLVARKGSPEAKDIADRYFSKPL
jgi:hypothetical protein